MPSNQYELTAYFIHILHTTSMFFFKLKALGFLQAFQESADWALLSSLGDNSNSHISVFK